MQREHSTWNYVEKGGFCCIVRLWKERRGWTGKWAEIIKSLGSHAEIDSGNIGEPVKWFTRDVTRSDLYLKKNILATV